MIHRRIATYTDGTEVNEGDRIRYRQVPGGLLPPPADNAGDPSWTEGTAVKLSEYQNDPARRQKAIDNGVDVDELVLLDANGRRYSIVGHIVERR